MIDVESYVGRLGASDLDQIVSNLQTLQAALRETRAVGNRAERDAARERAFLTAVLIGALIYEVARASGETDSHARLLGCTRLDKWAPELHRGLLFLYPERVEPA